MGRFNESSVIDTANCTSEFGPNCVATRRPRFGKRANVDLFEDLVVGFRLDPGQPVRQERGTSLSEPEAGICTLVEMVGVEFARDDVIIELTGGVDSRLVLALGVSGGHRPASAITIGTHDDVDVQVASNLCERLAIRHCVIPVVVDVHMLETDIETMVRHSSYCANATSYGWLPSIFRRLSAERTAQVGGSGGEVAAGFYYSPFDGVFDRVNVVDLWCRVRLCACGRICREIVGRDFPILFAALLSRLRECLGEHGQPWRERLDLFYRYQRLEHWAKPVLQASSAWYRPVAPLMSDAYWQWSRSLSATERWQRRGQIDLIRRLAPELLTIPFAGQLSQQGKRWRNPLMNAVTKAYGRVRGRRRVADKGSQCTAEALVRHTALPSLVRDFGKSTGLNQSAVQTMLERPSEFARELGVLVTNALRWRDYAGA